MRRLIIVAVLLAACIAAGARFFGTQNEAEANLSASIARLLIEEDLLDRRFDGMLTYSAESFARDFEISRPIVVNESPTGSEVAILAVSSAAYTRLTGDERRHAIVRASRNNFLSVAPNLILIDGRLAGLLYLTSYNDALATAQLRFIVREESADPDLAAGRFSSVDRILDLNNIEAVLTDDNTTVFDGLVEGFNDVERRYPGTTDAIADAFAVALYPILLHEFGHLSRNDSGGFFPGLESTLRDSIRDEVRRREEEADDFASTKLGEFSRRAPESFRPYQMLSSVEFLRELAISNAFEGFRELPASAHYVRLYQRDCLSPAGPRRLQRGYADIEAVESGDFGLYPLLTRAEFDQVSSRLRERVGETHSHQALRSRRFLEAFIGAQESRESTFQRMLTELEMIDALVRGDLSAYDSALDTYYPLSTNGSGDLGISEVQLRSLFPQEFWSFEEAAACPGSTCYVIRLPQRLGFGEAVIVDGRVHALSFTMPLFGQSPGSSPAGTNPEEYFLAAAAQLKFVHLAVTGEIMTPETQAHPEVMDLALGFRESAQQCNYGRLVASGPSTTLIGSIVNERNWASFYFLPN